MKMEGRSLCDQGIRLELALYVCEILNAPSRRAGLGAKMDDLRFRRKGYHVVGGSSSKLMYTGSGLCTWTHKKRGQYSSSESHD